MPLLLVFFVFFGSLRSANAIMCIIPAIYYFRMELIGYSIHDVISAKLQDQVRAKASEILVDITRQGLISRDETYLNYLIDRYITYGRWLKNAYNPEVGRISSSDYAKFLTFSLVMRLLRDEIESFNQETFWLQASERMQQAIGELYEMENLSSQIFLPVSR